MAKIGVFNFHTVEVVGSNPIAPKVKKILLDTSLEWGVFFMALHIIRALLGHRYS
jgi:hypothetical protein